MMVNTVSISNSKFSIKTSFNNLSLPKSHHSPAKSILPKFHYVYMHIRNQVTARNKVKAWHWTTCLDALQLSDFFQVYME